MLGVSEGMDLTSTPRRVEGKIRRLARRTTSSSTKIKEKEKEDHEPDVIIGKTRIPPSKGSVFVTMEEKEKEGDETAFRSRKYPIRKKEVEIIALDEEEGVVGVDFSLETEYKGRDEKHRIKAESQSIHFGYKKKSRSSQESLPSSSSFSSADPSFSDHETSQSLPNSVRDFILSKKDHTSNRESSFTKGKAALSKIAHLSSSPSFMSSSYSSSSHSSLFSPHSKHNSIQTRLPFKSPSSPSNVLGEKLRSEGIHEKRREIPPQSNTNITFFTYPTASTFHR
jgi:hypothetical protein